MLRRTSILIILLALFLAACSPGEEQAEETTTTTTEVTTTSTLPPTTTTTTISLTIQGAPAGLVTAVEDFYLYASGAVDTEPAAPAQVVSALRQTANDFPTSGSAETATFLEQQVAVVETGPDVFLAVDDGSGWRIVGGDWPSLEVPAYFGGAPRFVAVVGSDARPGQTMENYHADSIHFVALDGEGGGAVVGLPRDSFVPVPGFGSKKITASLALGGPDVMMQAFTDLTGLPLEGYVLTGFEGFEELAGTVLGGVEVDVPFSINDKWAHVALSAGKQLLDGAEALGFARARKTVGGDLVRSGHQGLILLGAAEMVKAMGYSAIPGLLEASEEHLLTSLTPEQLLTFSAMAISSDIVDMPNVVAQGRVGTAQGASVVFLYDSVSELWADLADAHLEED